VVKIIQGSVVTQTTLGGLTIYPPVANFLWCTCARNYGNWVTVDKVIAKIIWLTFFGPPCTVCCRALKIAKLNRDSPKFTLPIKGLVNICRRRGQREIKMQLNFYTVFTVFPKKFTLFVFTITKSHVDQF